MDNHGISWYITIYWLLLLFDIGTYHHFHPSNGMLLIFIDFIPYYQLVVGVIISWFWEMLYIYIQCYIYLRIDIPNDISLSFLEICTYFTVDLRHLLLLLFMEIIVGSIHCDLSTISNPTDDTYHYLLDFELDYWIRNLLVLFSILIVSIANYLYSLPKTFQLQLLFQ